MVVIVWTLVSAFAVMACAVVVIASIIFATIEATATEDPADYPAMRAALMAFYQKAPNFLPQTIPDQAGEIFFTAHKEDGLQASPGLELSYTLPDEAMTLELKRLNTFGNLRLGTSARLDLGNDPDLIAIVRYDAEDDRIWYSLGSD